MLKLLFENIKNQIYIKTNKKQIKINFLTRIDKKILEKINTSGEISIIRNSVLRGNIEIGEGVKILGEISCSGDIKIGNFTSISGPSSRISGGKNGVIIGNFCSIASNVIIQENNHITERITSYFINNNLFGEKKPENQSKGKIIIEDDVWIGSNSVILSGVTIGRGSIIGAGSVVTKSIEPYSVAVGNPARVIKKRFNSEEIKKLESMQWWNWGKNKLIKNSMIFKKKVSEILDYNIKE